MEESCLFLLCVRSTQTFFIISPLYRFQQAFFDKESVFPPHFMPRFRKKRRSLRLFQLLQRFLHRVRRERNTPPHYTLPHVPQWNAARSLS